MLLTECLPELPTVKLSWGLLDPLADKVVVLGCMFSLLAIGRFHYFPVLIITIREIGISNVPSHESTTKDYHSCF